MRALNLLTARDKVLADIRRCIADIRAISELPAESIEDGIRLLAELRKATYEDLNQIQHEYAVLCAIEWLITREFVPEGVLWQWNPRQTGDAAEPDVRALSAGRTIISGEVTTSLAPKGFIDSRMASTLRKLASMEGRQFYFVLTPVMAARARTKVKKAGYSVDVVQLTEAAPNPLEAAG